MGVIALSEAAPGAGRTRRPAAERLQDVAAAMVDSTLPGRTDLSFSQRERLLLSRADTQEGLAAARLMAMVRSGGELSSYASTSLRRVSVSAMPLAYAAGASEAMLAAGDAPRALRCALRAHEQAERLGGAPWRYRTLSLLAAGYAANGLFADATTTLDEAHGVQASEGWADDATDPFALLADVLGAARRADAERLRELGDTAASVSLRRPAVRILADVLEAQRRWLIGDDSRALALASRIVQGAGAPAPFPFVRDFALRLQATILLQRGEPLRAAGLMRDELPDGHHLSCPATLRAAAQLHVGDPSRALFETQDCMRKRVEHNLLSFPLMLLVRAAAHLRLGQPDSTLRLLADAVAFGDANPSSPLPDLAILPPAEAGDLVDLAERHSLLPEEAIRELRTRRPASAPPPDRRCAPDAIGMLSRRERDVADVLPSPLEFTQIAEHLHVSMNTVKTHTRSIYRKLSVSSRHEAVIALTTIGYYER